MWTRTRTRKEREPMVMFVWHDSLKTRLVLVVQPDVVVPVVVELLALRDPTTPPTTAPTMRSGTMRAAKMTTLLR